MRGALGALENKVIHSPEREKAEVSTQRGNVEHGEGRPELPAFPPRMDVDWVGSQDSTEHCQGKRWVYHTRPIPGSCPVPIYPCHTFSGRLGGVPSPDSSLRTSPSFFIADGATGSQSGPGNSAYGELALSQPHLPLRWFPLPCHPQSLREGQIPSPGLRTHRRA